MSVRTLKFHSVCIFFCFAQACAAGLAGFPVQSPVPATNTAQEPRSFPEDGESTQPVRDLDASVPMGETRLASNTFHATNRSTLATASCGSSMAALEQAAAPGQTVDPAQRAPEHARVPAHQDFSLGGCRAVQASR